MIKLRILRRDYPGLSMEAQTNKMRPWKQKRKTEWVGEIWEMRRLTIPLLALKMGEVMS